MTGQDCWSAVRTEPPLDALRPEPASLGLGRPAALDPAGLDAGGHDHGLGLGAGQLEAVESALVAGRLGAAALGPADEIVGGAAGQILDAS